MSGIKSKVKKIIGKDLENEITCILGIRYKDEFEKYKNKKKIIYMLVPTHGNMGDQAIALATLKYLNDKFNDYHVVEIYRKDTYKYIKAIKNMINEDDIIVLHGGGNMGNLYPVEEHDRRFIIKKFPDNKIISMTQTISFTDDEEGQKELAKTKKEYNNHNDLTIIAREKKSYETMKREFDIKNIVLNPDIVLYLNDKLDTDNIERTQIMTCLRSDKESLLGGDKDVFISNLNKDYENVFNYDTVIDKTLKGNLRVEELNDMFEKFMASKVVITDRLHGMVFAAITKTPCIVTKSLDHKVTGTYEWIKDLNYIRLVNGLEYDKITPIINEFLELDDKKRIDLDKPYFNKLREALMEKKN